MSFSYSGDLGRGLNILDSPYLGIVDGANGVAGKLLKLGSCVAASKVSVATLLGSGKEAHPSRSGKFTKCISEVWRR